MKVPYLSATRLKMISNCTLAYQMQYDPPSQEARVMKELSNHPSNLAAAYLGTNLHNALERWREPDENGKVPKPVLKTLMQFYDDECSKNIMPPNFYDDGKRMLLRWFSRRGKDPVRVKGVEMAFGSHRAPYKTQKGTPIFGMIDLVIEHKDGTIELVDYKSQRAPISQDEADNDVQAGMYLCVAREWWPDRPLIFTFDLLRYGTVSTIWSDDKIDNFSSWIHTQYEYIKGLEQGVASISSSCQYCAFKSVCPRVEELMNEDLWTTVISATWDGDNEMLQQLQRIKYAQGILSKQRGKIEGDIKARLAGVAPEDAKIDTEDYNLHWTTQERKEYIPSEIQRHVNPAVFGQLVTVSKSRLSAAKDVLDDETVKAIEDSAITKWGRRLNVKKKNK